MFLHLYKYRILKMIRTKEEIFWTFMFPLILGSFFFFAFNSITERTESFTSIPVAIVVENEADSETFKSIISSLDKNSSNSEDSLFDVTYTDTKDADDLLKNGEVEGIITLKYSISLKIKENGINQTILKSFVDNYIQIQSVIETVGKDNPANITKAVSALLNDDSMNKELPLTNSSLDPMLLYFYALIAMSCLFGSQLGCSCATLMKADLSTLGCRRGIAPVHRMTVILADFLATITVHFSSILLLIFYLYFVLNIDLGDRLFHIILTSFVGSIIGVSYGIFIGSFKGKSENVKMALVMGVTMLFSFFSGLMVADMKYTVEQFCPLLNRINPAALISDALYSLNIYDSYEKYISRIIIMLIFAVVFCVLSYLVTRRENYDNL